MAFNFFGKKKAETPAPPDEETPEDAAEPDESEVEDDEEGIPEAADDEDAIDLDWRARAATWIPGGTSPRGSTERERPPGRRTFSGPSGVTSPRHPSARSSTAPWPSAR
jgi:hypothetical protein